MPISQSAWCISFCVSKQATDLLRYKSSSNWITENSKSILKENRNLLNGIFTANNSTHKVFLASAQHQLNKDLFSTFRCAVKRLGYCHQQLVTDALRYRTATHIDRHMDNVQTAATKTPHLTQKYGHNVSITIIITKDIYIAQVRKGHKCAASAEMAVWLHNCLCLYSYLHN